MAREQLQSLCRSAGARRGPPLSPFIDGGAAPKTPLLDGTRQSTRLLTVADHRNYRWSTVRADRYSRSGIVTRTVTTVDRRCSAAGANAQVRTVNAAAP